MQKLKYRVASALLALGLGIGGAVAQDAALEQALQQKSAQARDLAAAVGAGQVTRVIVRLKGGLDGPQAITAGSAQQNRSLQDSFAAGFMAGDATRSARAGMRKLGTQPSVALNVDARDLQALANDNQVEGIWIDELSPPGLSGSVPLIGMTASPASAATGSGTIVAILDTGVDRNHPFLSANVVRESCFSSAVSGQSTSLCPDGTDEQHGTGAAQDCTAAAGCGHGSHVAGIAAGKGTSSPSRGVAPDAKIYAIQVFSLFPGTYSTCATRFSGNPCVLTYNSDQIAALDYIRTQFGTFSQTMVAANMSLGGGNNTTTCDGDSRKSVIDQLKALGVATVISSGNDSFTNATGSPG
jgi:subtilisin family serine protease